MPLLSIEELTVIYHQASAPVVTAVDRVSLSIDAADVVAVVGESGCGKSSLALAVTKLIQPPGEITGGRVMFDGEDVLRASEETLRKVRGCGIGYVFQDPSTSLNPVLTIGWQLREAIELHTPHRGAAADVIAVGSLERVGIPSPRERLHAYPHELSGGQQQRVMLAMAIAAHPRLLIADEPTTALDVTVQVQILQLLRRLVQELRLSILLISHDLTVVERLATRLAVMDAGRIVEAGPTAEVLARPSHPMTKSLIAARPSLPLRHA